MVPHISSLNIFLHKEIIFSNTEQENLTKIWSYEYYDLLNVLKPWIQYSRLLFLHVLCKFKTKLKDSMTFYYTT